VLHSFREVNPYRTATSLISSTFSLYSQSAEQKNEVRDTEFNPSELFLYGTLTAFGFYEIEIIVSGRDEGYGQKQCLMWGEGRVEERTVREKSRFYTSPVNEIDYTTLLEMILNSGFCCQTFVPRLLYCTSQILKQHRLLPCVLIIS